MTREELKEHCKKQIEICEMWAKAKGENLCGKVYEEHKLILELLEQESCKDCISREDLKRKLQEYHDLYVNAYGGFSNLPLKEKARVDEITSCIAEVVNMPSVYSKPKMGRWMRKTKVEGVYDIAGIKTWGVKCQCEKCDFTTTVIEDFGYYKYCPNCGAKMIESQESEAERDKELENPFNDCRFGG